MSRATTPASPSTSSAPLPAPTAWSVVEHHAAVQLLQRTLTPGSSPRHAYLLLGAPQVGKRTLATAFAQALLCTADGPRPCGVCRACRLIANYSHPDLRVVQPTRKGERDKEFVVDRINGTLRSEQAAEIIHEAALRPVEARYKVFLIQEFHTANPTFANKLLKTLEEPPDHVILLLTALDRESVLPTILSRCQVVELRPVAVAALETALLTRWQADPATARTLAQLAHGRVGWAVQQLQDPAGPTHRQDRLHQLWELVRAGRLQRLNFGEKLAADRDNQELFGLLELWTSWWRDVLLTQVGCADACAHIDHADELAAQAAALDVSAVRAYLATLLRVEGYLRHTVNTRLALDVLLLRLPHVAATSKP